MEPINRIKNCINWIITRFPFFAQVLISLELQADLKTERACTNGKILKFNPAWISKLSRDHLIFLLLHESAHLFFKHHLRMQGKNHKLWNMASDYVINLWLQEQGFKPIPDILLDQKYRGMLSEKVYNLLQDENQAGNNENQQKEQSTKSENLGEIEQFSNDPKEIEKEEKEIDSKIQQGGILSKLAGNENGNLQEWVRQQREAKINIPEILQDIVSEISKNDYTYDSPNFRYIEQGYFPSLRNYTLGKIACFVDASGSIDIPLFNQLISEVIQAKSQGIEFDLFLFDVSVYQEIRDFQGDEKIQISGGGTDFNCIPAHLEKINENYAAILIFTDGYSSIDYEFDKAYWIIYDNPSFNCFGNVYHVSN